MRLTKLKLAGFKTFVDPAIILTPSNLVGVVGPNGCGKSNVIDAVRWVLGETRASALRGESMHDVIFNGSVTRKPVSRASVELVFDNHEGRAGGQWTRYNEISVKRVLDRSGDSSYYINGTHVRRKDVIDLFLGTGLGPRAYAIIEQGMISRIIEARPEEVRSFLEEAAGVTKYRERRRETEGRLADARDNLLRLDDIRLELEQRIEVLRRQADEAQRYQQLQADCSKRQHQLWFLKYEQAEQQQARLKEELAQTTLKLEQDSERLRMLEDELEQARAAHFETSEQTHAAHSDLLACTAQVSQIENDLRHGRESRIRLEKQREQLQQEVVRWHERRQGLEAEQMRWTQLLENAALRVEQCTLRHEEIALRLPQAQHQRQMAETTWQAMQRDVMRIEQLLGVEEAKRNNALRVLEGLQQRKQRIAGERADIQAQMPESGLMAENEMRLAELQDMCDQLGQQVEEIQRQLPQAQSVQHSLREQEKQAQKKVTEITARHQALVQLQSKATAQGQLGAWLKRHGLETLAPLWRSLEVEPGWEAAISAILREKLAALTGEVSHAVQAMLTEIPAESLVVVMERVPPATAVARVSVPENNGVPGHPAAEVVRVSSPALTEGVSDFLSGYAVVDNVADWLDVRHRLSEGQAFVDRQGRILDRNSLQHYAADNRTDGILERQREIDDLAMQLARLEEEALAAQLALEEAECTVALLQSRGNECRLQSQQYRQRLHDEQMMALKLQQTRLRIEDRLVQLDKEAAELKLLESNERSLLTLSETEHGRCSELLAVQQQRLEEAVEVFNEKNQLFTELSALEQTLNRELQEAGFSERECAGKLQDTANNLQLAAERLAQISEAQDNCERELAVNQTEESEFALQQALEQRAGLEMCLAQCRERQEAAARHLKATDELRLSIEQQAAPVRERVGALRLELQAAELAMTQFAQRLEEEHIDLAVMRDHRDTSLQEAGLQREIARLSREIGALGEVNLAALGELTTAADRKAYLDAQNADLTEAIGTLEDSIRRIDRETREQLQQTYDTVTKHFSMLFPQLFGGGQARLVLSGDEILDAGIQIVAQPPGKKNSSIHLLSGGEKALTAIALVFAMFQLNPAPFCMLDEVDAPLDDANTGRYCQMVKQMSSQTQFIFITHSKITMEIAQQLVGVTMQEKGASRVVEVDIEEAMKLAEQAVA